MDRRPQGLDCVLDRCMVRLMSCCYFREGTDPFCVAPDRRNRCIWIPEESNDDLCGGPGLSFAGYADLTNRAGCGIITASEMNVVKT